ncbi:hypothetical protein ACQEVZ_24030 [Dactylosporangium sp. CA-152071]|uniref:hypothetical protein n=1 Tax=Dactylosporangium sp. CA-152071 TaxID=3239933 RepID=UPI003D8DB4DB
MTFDPWYAVLLAGLVIPVLLLVGGVRDVLAYVAAYFFLFGFGPVVSYLLGGAIYFGTNTALIGRAALGLLLAFAGVLAAGLLVRQRHDIAAPATTHRFPLLPVVLALLTLYATTVLVLGGTSFLAGTKLDRIDVAGPGHYDYLLFEMFACALYYMAGGSGAGRFTYRLNFAVYVVYCLSTGERDFVFVIFSLILHRELTRGGSFARPVGYGALLLVGATMIFSLRGDGPADTSQVLNQGSVLFVDTWVMTHVPSVEPFARGATYLHALVNLLPGHAQPALSQWLVDRYAPGSASGYGFSLTGEAYLNFGLWGIPALFAGLTAVHRLLINRLDRAPVYAYASVLFNVAWMYGFRGESGSLLKTCVYGLLFYGALRLVSVRVEEPTSEEPEAVPACVSS